MRNRLGLLIVLCLTVLLTAGSPVKEKKSLAPDFLIKDLDRSPVSLSDYKNKTSVVLFFWTTWCPYCQRELRKLNQNKADWEKDGIIILPINAGESSAKVARFVKSNGLNFRVFLDPDSQVSDSYQVYGVPSYFIIDKKGYIRSISNSFLIGEAKAAAGEK